MLTELVRKREARGLGLREFARLHKLQPAYVSRWERGQVKDPKLSTVIKMSKAYSVSYWYMLVLIVQSNSRSK